eukprot:9682575-Alexandrium_andersonii.AAC.1
MCIRDSSLSLSAWPPDAGRHRARRARQRAARPPQRWRAAAARRAPGEGEWRLSAEGWHRSNTWRVT